MKQMDVNFAMNTSVHSVEGAGEHAGKAWKEERVTGRKRVAIPSVVAGACAGALSKTVTAPIERIKLILQLHMAESKNISTKRSTAAPQQRLSALRIASHIYQNEGLLSFWKGNVWNVVRTGGAAGLNFMWMDIYQDLAASVSLHLLQDNKNKNHLAAGATTHPSWLTSLVSAGLAGGTATTILYPLEFFRTRMAMVSSPGTSYSSSHPTTTWTLTKHIMKTDGIGGFYRGYTVAVGGVIYYRALHLGVYDICKHYYLNKQPQQSSLFWTKFMVAQAVSLFASIMAYPIDTVRRRLMMEAGRAPEQRHYWNGRQCIRYIWTNEGGLAGFYKGMGPNLIRTIGGALLLVTYDTLKSM